MDGTVVPRTTQERHFNTKDYPTQRQNYAKDLPNSPIKLEEQKQA